jgi:hypothetical protein
MVRTQRAIRLGVSVVVAAVVSGGSAWAISGGVGAPDSDGRGHANNVTASTTLSADTSSTTATTDTMVVDSPTTTSVASTTTTTVVASSPTSAATSPTSVTTSPTSVTTSPTTQLCKPGWGYGDTNHCHSGPPGLAQPDHGRKQHPSRFDGTS